MNSHKICRRRSWTSINSRERLNHSITLQSLRRQPSKNTANQYMSAVFPTSSHNATTLILLWTAATSSSLIQSASSSVTIQRIGTEGNQQQHKSNRNSGNTTPGMEDMEATNGTSAGGYMPSDGCYNQTQCWKCKGSQKESHKTQWRNGTPTGEHMTGRGSK